MQRLAGWLVGFMMLKLKKQLKLLDLCTDKKYSISRKLSKATLKSPRLTPWAFLFVLHKFLNICFLPVVTRYSFGLAGFYF